MEGDFENADVEIDDQEGFATPSKFYQSIQDKKMIDYTRYDPNCWVNFEDYTIAELPLLKDQSIATFLDDFCQLFEEVEQDRIFTDVPDLVADVGCYFCELVPNKQAYQVAANWPPLIPQGSLFMNSIIYCLVRILHSLTDQSKFFHFIKYGFYKKVWTSKSCYTNQYLLSVCRATYKENPNYWAIINKDRQFKLYEIKDDKCEEKMSETILKAYVRTKEKIVEIVNIDQKTACVFQTHSGEQAVFWETLYSRQKIPFPFFMFESADAYPDVMYRAMYNMFTANDSVLLWSFLNSNKLEPKIWESLVYIYAHAKKMIFLAEGVFAHTFNDDFEFNIDSFSIPNHFTLFARAIGKVYFSKYNDEFFNKIISLIDYHDDIDAADISLVDESTMCNLLFNVLKYIVQGYAYVPKEWTYVLNILRQYVNVRYNSQALTLLAISKFFCKGILGSFFSENVKFIKGLSLAHPQLFSIVGYLLSVPFDFCIYSGPTEKFNSYNQRLEQHFFPKFNEFLWRISDFIEPFEFDIPDNKKISYSCHILLKHFMDRDFNDLIRAEFVRQMDDKTRIATLPAWNLCIILSNCFVHSTDPSEFVKKKKEGVTVKPLVFPQNLPTYGASYGSYVNAKEFSSFAKKGNTKKKENEGESRRRGMASTIHKQENKIVAEEGDDKTIDPFSDTMPETLELPDLPAAKRWKPTTLSDTDEESQSDVPKNKLKNDKRKRDRKHQNKEKHGGSIISFNSKLEESRSDDIDQEFEQEFRSIAPKPMGANIESASIASDMRSFLKGENSSTVSMQSLPRRK
ncbi:hypothetical protein TVAG_211620 [Trichomonas vaginalis G3]|uniref:Uncharacterized protein n=1 Tax=Trichomonas vaginalis (strain ATCC PRA-98 / G3) TaxID=412133 RepID=A2EL02_TRIV3|nr:hypothetical protein TVAGG3_1013740 [Trichomonas vaginalis G3]EAY06710.1 hypothetical protein TVAG_211620 [Trichomonas vaginalis G3]KAI5491674.1 hypothetical protein TVAGG3_1013740 [Trichomonas vaginalis G3]|eukprot:XP_001318933.1 hypothetical protein [Trichomonas vaginalis G3]